MEYYLKSIFNITIFWLSLFYLLLQESISTTDLTKATALLKHFCIIIKGLYDIKSAPSAGSRGAAAPYACRNSVCTQWARGR